MPTNCMDRIILTSAQVQELASAPRELISLDGSVEHVTPPKEPSYALRRRKGLANTFLFVNSDNAAEIHQGE